MQQDNRNTTSNQNSMIVHAVFPFHIIRETEGSIFDPVDSGLLGISRDLDLKSIRDILLKAAPDAGAKSAVGDFSKYYDFMFRHFGIADSSANLEVYVIEPENLFPDKEHSAYTNLGEQIGGQKYKIGLSDITLERLDRCLILLNPIARLGYFVFEFCLFSSNPAGVIQVLSGTEYFRNIGWRQGQELPKKNKPQYNKHALSYTIPGEASPVYELTFYEIITIYFSFLKNHIRCYQNRLTTLFTSVDFETGNMPDDKLCNLFFEILRVPDMNVRKFDHENTEPAVMRIGRNVVCAALNEGAVVMETVNVNHNKKATANKYLPAFILAINQRELLLKTMQQVSVLNAQKLMSMDEVQLQSMEYLKATLLILQLKQIFYSVSNTHEVELFFSQLQKVFNIEVMLKENEQSIREMYNLLELKKADEQKRFREIEEIKEKEIEEKEENRAKIVNAILGVIACLGLFSFLKDLLPFLKDDIQYFPLYKFLSVALPFSAGIWLIWYMFGRTKK